MCSVLLCVGGESTAVGKSPISLVLLTLLLQPQHQQKSLGRTRLTQVVIFAEHEPRLAGGVIGAGLFSSLSASFFALHGERWLLLGGVWKSWVPGQAPSCLGEVRLLLRHAAWAVQLQRKREVSACRQATVSRHATIISLLNSVCSQISFQIY